MTDVEFLRGIITGLVENKEEVKIVRTTDEMGVLLMVSVAKTDMGMLIGRQGTTINAVRHIVKCFGKSLNSNLNVKIEEPA